MDSVFRIQYIFTYLSALYNIGVEKRIENIKNITREIDFAAESFARILIEQVLTKKGKQTDINMKTKYGKSN